MEEQVNPVGPVDATQVPRFAGFATFARLPRLEDVSGADVAVLGVPFDSGVSYRPGARFGPAAVREASRLLRPYHPSLDIAPFESIQVVDAGDVAANPFDIGAAIHAIEERAGRLLDGGTRLVALGGDHTIALPMLRAVSARHGPLALLHFDAHLDTWDTYFGAAFTHGTPFRRAFEEGLLDTQAVTHVGIRGPLYGREDLDEDARMGFGIFTSADVLRTGVDQIVEALCERVADRPLYVSVDIDVLDPAHAPGTGTPEAGGMTSRELLELVRGLAGRTRLVGADVVEVAPPYDHAELTAIAASHVVYDLIALLAVQQERERWR